MIWITSLTVLTMKINIITRTHCRPQYFEVCKQSIESQTYKDINWIVGTDADCPYYPQAHKVIKNYQQPLYVPDNMYFAPWNTYLNQLQELVTDGWVMYLDDDDKFTTEKSLQRIMNAIDNDNQLLIWKVKIFDGFVVPNHTFGKYIQAGDFSGIGMCFHSKHLPVDWGNLSYGDYRVATQLIRKTLQPKWIDMVLTQTQNGANNGK